MLATATEPWKSLNVKFSVKIHVPIDRVFYVTVANADIGSLKYHFLNKYLATVLQNVNIFR